MNVLRASLYVVGVCSLIALAVFAALAAWGKSRALYSFHSGRSSAATHAFLILAGIGFLICMRQGAMAMLDWMPSTWGSIDDDGGFISSAENLASLFAVGAGLALATVLSRATHDRLSLAQAREQNDHLRKALEASLDEDRLESVKEAVNRIVGELRAEIGSEHKSLGRKSWIYRPEGQRMVRLEELIDAIDKQQVRLRRAKNTSATSVV
jgi:hypothetical protein